MELEALSWEGFWEFISGIYHLCHPVEWLCKNGFPKLCGYPIILYILAGIVVLSVINLATD